MHLQHYSHMHHSAWTGRAGARHYRCTTKQCWVASADLPYFHVCAYAAAWDSSDSQLTLSLSTCVSDAVRVHGSEASPRVRTLSCSAAGASKEKAFYNIFGKCLAVPYTFVRRDAFHGMGGEAASDLRHHFCVYK